MTGVKSVLLLIVIIMGKHTFSQPTRFEVTNGRETATYAEVIEFYKKLEKTSRIIKMKEQGPTDAGFPLRLLFVSTDGNYDPVKWHKEKKAVILINNGIHPGEPDGIDATMMLLRDINNR